MGETEKALEVFKDALRDSRAKSGPWEWRLHQRILQTDDHQILALWVEAYEAANRTN
jgi:hypothetical protein